MQTKALIIAIADYPKLNKNLKGPPNDLILWSDLFASDYRLRCTPLVPPAATKEGIKKELESFVAGATTGDNLVVVFSGHGTSTIPQSRPRPADGLVAYMSDDMNPADIDNYVLYDFEIEEIIQPVKESGALLTFILDCCFAAGVGGNLPPPPFAGAAYDATYDAPPPRSANRFVDVSQFAYGDRRRRKSWWPFCRRRFASVLAGKRNVYSAKKHEPLILVATESDSAYEGCIDGKVYGLFSRHATKRLAADVGISHETLAIQVHTDLRTIEPTHYDQSPDVMGRSGRDLNPFLT